MACEQPRSVMHCTGYTTLEPQRGLTSDLMLGSHEEYEAVRLYPSVLLFQNGVKSQNAHAVPFMGTK